jgi:hypothetical protein
MSKWQRKDKEREKNPGIGHGGQTRYGSIDPQEGTSSPPPPSSKGGSDASSAPLLRKGSVRDGKVVWQPKGNQARPPRAAGADAKLKAAFNDLQAQEKGTRDALAEISADKDVAEKANISLRRELQENTLKLEAFETSMQAEHRKWAQNFVATWEEDAPKSYLYLYALIPALLFWALILWVNLEDCLADLEWVINHDDARLQVALFFQYVYCHVTWWVINRYITSCGMRNLFSPRIKHEYRMVSLTNYTHPDLRADSMAMSDLKHANAIYGLVEYAIRLNGRLINKDIWGKLTCQPGQMLISMELLAQLSTPTCMQSIDEKTTQARLQSFAKSSHFTNIDKYLSWKKHDVVGSTVTVALGIWKDRLEHRVGYFPATLA